MPVDDQNLSEELEKLETISGKKTCTFMCDENPFQKRSKCITRTPSTLWHSRCFCPYEKKAIRSTVSFKRNSGKILKQATFKYNGQYHQNNFKLDELNDNLPINNCESETIGDKNKQCVPCSQPPLSVESDDVSMYELASYFEILVDIPKQMSTMAEMMYL